MTDFDSAARTKGMPCSSPCMNSEKGRVRIRIRVGQCSLALWKRVGVRWQGRVRVRVIIGVVRNYKSGVKRKWEGQNIKLVQKGF